MPSLSKTQSLWANLLWKSPVSDLAEKLEKMLSIRFVFASSLSMRVFIQLKTIISPEFYSREIEQIESRYYEIHGEAMREEVDLKHLYNPELYDFCRDFKPTTMWDMQAKLDKEDPGARLYLLKDDGTKMYVPSRKSERILNSEIADYYSNSQDGEFVQLHLQKPGET